METEIKCPYCESTEIDTDDLWDFEFEATTALAIWSLVCKKCGKRFFRHDEYKLVGGTTCKPRE